MIDLSRVRSPKLHSGRRSGKSSWFPYYAGFSWEFAYDVIAESCLDEQARVLDPWNGSGTTTSASAAQGKTAYGIDLNPAMVVVAQARLLNKRSGVSLVPIADAVSTLVKSLDVDVQKDDPLLSWFHRSSVRSIRNIQRSIHELLTEQIPGPGQVVSVRQDQLSDLAASLYVALFRSIRELTLKFRSSNPTWTKAPVLSQRIRPHQAQVVECFLRNVLEMSTHLQQDPADKDGPVVLQEGSSESLDIESESLDLVVSSPPYCTRIDYASATRIELAVLGYKSDVEFENLRRSLIGTTTVPKEAPQEVAEWGETCLGFLNAVKNHPSKSSKSYYYKNLCQYFSSVSRSIAEISRCLKPSRHAVLVVQDSYYKDLHVDLAKIVGEIGKANGLSHVNRRDYESTRNMARVNPLSSATRSGSPAVESVLILQKT